MSKEIPNGVWPVMLTPFAGARKRRIDFQGLKELVDWYIGQGVHGLFAACLSSEVLHMSDAEKLILVKHVIEYADGRVPVVAGVLGVEDRQQRIEMARKVVDVGAEAAVLTLCDIVSQHASDEEWIEEMELHIHDLKGYPLGLYECPVPYHRMLTPALTDYVARHSDFLFLKETSGHLDELERKSRAGAASGLKVFSADALTIKEALHRGINGFSGLQGNLWPALFVKLCDCRETDPELAARLQQFFVEQNWAVNRSYPASAKRYLKTAHGLEINSTSFLNAANVTDDDQEWINDLAETVDQFQRGISNPVRMTLAATA